MILLKSFLDRFVLRHRKLLLASAHLLIWPGVLLVRWLTGRMFQEGKPCTWAIVGLECGTCGGTHCVQSFVYGDILASFRYNPLVFVWICFGILNVVLVDLWLLADRTWAKKTLRTTWSMPGFFIMVGTYIQFTFLRNVPALLQMIF